MKKIVLTLLSAFLISLTFAQTPKVKNLDLKIENNKVLFNYDLITKKTNEIQTIELFLIDDDFNIFVPKKIKGDFGTKVLPGENKQIEWDIELIGEIRDSIRECLVQKLRITDEQDFYPFLED